MTKEELVCLFYTFDYALTDREYINILISSLKSYHKENDSLLEQAEIIENAFKNNEIEFVGTHQTTVSCSYWYDNNCVDEPKGWLIFGDKILKKKIEAKDKKNKLKGEKIKLKDYKGEYICYFNNFREIEIVDADDVDYIKELSSEGKVFYGTTKEKVFESPYWDIRHMIDDNVSNLGYEDMEDRISYDTDEFKSLVSAYEKWIESLGADNNIYYQDENIIIEAEDESME